MKMIDLNWSDIKGEGSVKYSKTFNEAHIIVKLDMLVDCIYDLQEKYNSLLTQPEEKQNGTDGIIPE
jgi:hypothetical protein